MSKLHHMNLKRAATHVCCENGLIVVPYVDDSKTDHDDDDEYSDDGDLEFSHMKSSMYGVVVTTTDQHEYQILRGHDCPVTSLCVAKNGRMIVSCSNDAIVVWKQQNDRIFDECGCVLQWESSDNALISDCVLNDDATTLAVCTDNAVTMIDIRTSKHIMILQAEHVVSHMAFANGSEFLHDHFVTVCDASQSVSIWNIHEQRLEYESYRFIGVAEIMCMCTRQKRDEIVLGDINGSVHVYRYDGTKLIRVHTVSVSTSPPKILTQQAPVTKEPVVVYARSPSSSHQTISDDSGEEVLSCESSKLTTSITLVKCVEDDHGEGVGTLYACTSNRLVAVDLATLQLSTCIQVSGAEDCDTGLMRIGASDIMVAEGTTVAALACAMSPNVYITNVVDESPTYPSSKENHVSSFSLLVSSDRELDDKSPLSKWKYTPSQSTSKHRQKPAAKGRRKKSVVMDKPVTFHTKIKSSGYGGGSAKQTPNAKLRSKRRNGGGGGVKSKSMMKNAHDDGIKSEWANTDQSSAIQIAREPIHAHMMRITQLAYNPTSGTHLLSCSADRAAMIHRPAVVTKNTALRVAIHDAPITCGAWSSSSRHVVTCGLDNKVCVWNAQNGGDPLLTLNTIRRTKKSTVTALKDVSSVSFFHADHFLLLTYGNTLSLHKYELNHLRKNDLVRTANNSRHSCVFRNTTEAKSITTAVAMNSVISDSVLWCDSRKSVNVCDMNVGRTFVFCENAHNRNIHTMYVSDASTSSVCSTAAHTFATASTDGSVKLWDTRSHRCSRTFQGGHLNTSQTIGLSMSPCGHYLAMGSEDGQAVIYDVKSASVYHHFPRVRGCAATAIAMHPTRRQCSIAYEDGYVRVFNM